MVLSDQSWIFSTGVNVLSEIGRAFGIVWLAAMIVSVAYVVGLLFRLDWWATPGTGGYRHFYAGMIIWFRFGIFGLYALGKYGFAPKKVGLIMTVVGIASAVAETIIYFKMY